MSGMSWQGRQGYKQMKTQNPPIQIEVMKLKII